MKLSTDLIQELFFETTKNLTLKTVKGGDTNVAGRKIIVGNLQLLGPLSRI